MIAFIVSGLALSSMPIGSLSHIFLFTVYAAAGGALLNGSRIGAMMR